MKYKNLEEEIKKCMNSLEKLQDIDFFKEFIFYVLRKSVGKEKELLKAYHRFIQEDRALREECKEDVYKKVRKIGETFWPFVYYFIRCNLENLYKLLEDWLKLTEKS
mgnify:CR=1 FL=1